MFVANKYGFDSDRAEKCDDLKKEIMRYALNYLKVKKIMPCPKYPEKPNYNSYVESLLDDLAFIALKKYSIAKKGEAAVEKDPKTAVNCNPGAWQKALSYLLTGKLNERGTTSFGGWHQIHSEIGNGEATVTFYFDFTGIENSDLVKKWQEGVRAAAAADAAYEERMAAARNYKPKFVRIKDAQTMYLILENGRTIRPKDNETRIYSDTTGNVFEKFQAAEWGQGLTDDYKHNLNHSYVDINKFPLEQSGGGGKNKSGKSTRRYKQKKLNSMKYQSRRCKTTRR